MAAELVLQTLERLWAALDPLQLPMAVAGGLALAAWKHPRATRDVDVVVGIGGQRPADVLRCVTDQGFRCKRDPAVVSLGSIQVLQLEYEPPDAYVAVQADVLLVDSEFHRQSLQRRVQLSLPHVPQPLYVLSCEDTILYKLLAGRVIDRADVVALLRANREALDWTYLSRWATPLQVADELHAAWDEAYPRAS